MPSKRKISVIGLGYVGLTIVTAFGQHQKVIGYDVNETRIAELKKGEDINEEVSSELIKNPNLTYTTNPEDLKKADFYIIAVLTPINEDKQPDLSILLAASKTLGQYLKKGDIVVYESTVYPGATEEKCIPALEEASHLHCGKDFSVGYSPERINPGDKQHTFSNIIKIVSAIDEPTLDVIAEVYASAIPAGVHRVSNIRIAEATKVIENTQRDLNISLINEMALILHSIGMDSYEVINAARTKWNFLPFKPGLVGGHCIGVNSYYLANKAEQAGYHPDVILAGRRVNNYMTKFIAQTAIKKLIHLGITIKGARIVILGLTYKENTADLHDTRVIALISELESYGAQVVVHDPIADQDLAKTEYGIELQQLETVEDFDALILAVAHKQYLALSKERIQKLLHRHGLLMDLKGIFNPKDFLDTGITLWRL